MARSRMHADELDEGIVRRLLREQFSDWVGLALERVEPEGTVNAVFRLGERLSVRLPRRDRPAVAGGKELEWLPRLAPVVPLEVPVPVAQGHPSGEYPWFWEVHTWVEGESVPVGDIDAPQAARAVESAYHGAIGSCCDKSVWWWVRLSRRAVRAPGDEERRTGVPRYVVLTSWTDQGVKGAKDTVNRYQAAKQLAESKGCKFESVHWTQGPYDLVSVIDAPDDETAAALGLQLGATGNLRSLSMRAFTEDEMKAITAKMD